MPGPIVQRAGRLTDNGAARALERIVQEGVEQYPAGRLYQRLGRRCLRSAKLARRHQHRPRLLPLDRALRDAGERRGGLVGDRPRQAMPGVEGV